LPDLIIADEWATGKFDGRANAHPGPPLAMPLVPFHRTGVDAIQYPNSQCGDIVV